MPRLILFVCCRSASVDYATNSLSLFDIVEQGEAAGFPAGFPEFTIVTLWRRNEDEADAGMIQNVVLVDPDGQKLGEVETRFTFEKLRHRITNRIQGLGFPKSGVYEFQLFVRREGSQASTTPVWSYPVHMVQASTTAST